MKVQFQETIVSKGDAGYDGLASAQIAAVLALLRDSSKTTYTEQANGAKEEMNKSSADLSAKIHESGGDQQ
mgnify:CR=1 FL=1